MSGIAYAYDGEGRRVQKTVGTSTTTFVYDAMGQLAAEYSATAAVAAGPQYLITDMLGSTRLVLDSSGAVKERMDYLPFGEELTATIGGRSNDYSPGAYPAPAPDIESLKFTGKERDAETGLDYFGARYFSAPQGRFTSPDFAGPELINPQTLNKYRYALNNPLRYVDPNGLYEQDVHFDLTQVLAYAAGYSAAQATRIAARDQGIDDNPDTEPFASHEARVNFHFTSAARRADMWNNIYFEEGLGAYLHAEQDSFSHAGFWPEPGHAWSHGPDKTYNDPKKADAMADDTYRALIEAGVKIGTQAGAVPYLEILPFIQGFNRARTSEQKSKQLDLLRQFIDQYRKNPKKVKKAGISGDNSYYCSPDVSACR